MTKPVCKGDRTSHGGVVKTASATFTLDGRKVALIEDIVSCPEHGDNPIIEHGEGYGEGGRKWVVDGCRTQCGSRVIAGTDGMKIR
ncbi:PAAR domain-containing protein [Paraburkholderia phenoliruptrix]|uniref:PAAR domain-containing protein n=1 Tax=Paraburkholderia phenoliruptrix TaxID=252970 RepID=UPI001C6DF841|nr:PAAR domain-containing protein [Paraburkholderia phenoliruptrix]MBW9107019.1 PAAR domain-containing protein [Paraburkholderia phenoliruptrix]MBW9108049.1 PAAR domain-containing protein [Paraburkholderia phenoliruptrix]MBW9129471.1 PAAR domain-containing protein [Paraburkholderia ginsengiterrae]MBW9133349.1 PAAR domain-containing protein [Paraburkholderia ginsengiterrae]